MRGFKRCNAGLTLLLLLGYGCSAPHGSTLRQQVGPQESTSEAPVDQDSDSRFFRDLLGNTGKLGGTPASQGQDPTGVLSNDTNPLDNGTKGDVLIAPIPFLNPTIGVGLAIGAAYLFPLAENAPPSTLGGGVFYSDNGTRGVALVFKGYFKDDKYRLTAGIANMRVNYDLTVAGFGQVPLQQDVIAGGAEFLARVTERVYFGPQFLLSGLDTRIRQDDQQGGDRRGSLDDRLLLAGPEQDNQRCHLSRHRHNKLTAGPTRSGVWRLRHRICSY